MPGGPVRMRIERPPRLGGRGLPLQPLSIEMAHTVGGVGGEALAPLQDHVAHSETVQRMGTPFRFPQSGHEHRTAHCQHEGAARSS